MMAYQTIAFSLADGVGTVALNRPDLRNAFNDRMIAELKDCFIAIQELAEVRIVCLKGNGKAFCAGADLNWMRDVQKLSYDANYRDSLNLAECVHAVYTCTKPTIAQIHGAAIGGANGLAAACDLAYCSDDTVFSFSEVKIGLIPAVIAPYVLKRIGEYGARALMLTGERFDGPTAAHYRLVNQSVPPGELESFVAKKIEQLLTSGPMAMTQCKQLLHDLNNRIPFSEALHYTAGIIAQVRASAEGQEGMAAFLEKRQPAWIQSGKKTAGLARTEK